MAVSWFSDNRKRLFLLHTQPNHSFVFCKNLCLVTVVGDYALLSQPKTTSEEALLLEKALRTNHHNGRSGVGILMHKSNSYSGAIVKPKSTIFNQGSINSRVNTSLTTKSVTEYSGIVLMPKTS
ncbi:uncharacterized protein ACN427_003560 isoform 1-T1 [Glossina fuscipes fuscipes]